MRYSWPKAAQLLRLPNPLLNRRQLSCHRLCLSKPLLNRRQLSCHLLRLPNPLLKRRKQNPHQHLHLLRSLQWQLRFQFKRRRGRSFCPTKSSLWAFPTLDVRFSATSRSPPTKRLKQIPNWEGSVKSAQPGCRRSQRLPSKPGKHTKYFFCCNWQHLQLKLNWSLSFTF